MNPTAGLDTVEGKRILLYFSIDIHIIDICVSAIDMSLILK